MKFRKVLPFIILLLLGSCIKDDIVFDTVEPEIRFTSSVDTLAIDDQFLFEVQFTDNTGSTSQFPVEWSSQDNSIISIDADGLATGISLGSVIITASVEFEGINYSQEKIVEVGSQTVITISEEKSGTIAPSSFYELDGDFTITDENGELIISFNDNYVADDGLPGLYLYLTNNPSTNAGGLEVQKVDIFEGAHEYRISGNVGLETYKYLLYYCKPFNVKVGDGEIN